MCGLVGFVESGPCGCAPAKAFKSLKDIEYRGYDSWGVAFKTAEGLAVVKQAGFIPDSYDLPSSNIAIGHTRWATHGAATDINAHPHLDCVDQIAVAANGIIDNNLKLRADLELRGHSFNSQTDTEVLSHMVEDLANNGNLLEATSYSYKKLVGSNTILVADQTGLVAIKNTAHLVLGELQTGFAVASDSEALMDRTNRFYSLNNGDVVLLEPNQDARVLRLSTLAPFQIYFEEIPRTSKAEKGEFPYFLLKEIQEQPDILRSIADNNHDAEKVAEIIKDAIGTFFIGCGSAGYAAELGAYLFSKVAKEHVNFVVGSEFNYLEDAIKERSLIIAVSQSGETFDTLESTQKAKDKGATVVALVNKVDSPLFKMADHPVPLRSGVEKAVASTKVVTAMQANMILMAYSIVGKSEEGREIVRRSAQEVQNIIDRKQEISDLADIIQHAEHMYCIGRGLSNPIAKETSLKIKEVAYIHAEATPGGEIKHGMLPTITAGTQSETDKSIGTPVIVFVPNDETKDAILANAKEVQARGAYVIGVSPDSHPDFDFHFRVADCGASSIIPNTVFAQILASELGLRRGTDLDRPRYLAKSLTTA
jgi:glutamine---fructose-6-phosphate transaminase (isomerizing)